MKNIPEFLEILKENAVNEVNPVFRLYKSLDLAEACIKYHTCIIVANYLETLGGRLSADQKEGTRILGRGLLRPSLGLWAFFTESIQPLIADNERFIPEFEKYFVDEFRKKTEFLVNLRNDYHHGLSRTDEAYLESSNAILRQIEEIFERSPVFQLSFHTGDTLEGSEEIFEIMVQKESGEQLNLSPLVVLRNRGGSLRVYFFYELDNKYKTKKISNLNYDTSHKWEDSDESYIREFKKVFKLKEWNDGPPSRFQARISELLQNFQGRGEEEERVLKYFSIQENGSLMVIGVPGIGKSAFLAKVVTSIRLEMEDRSAGITQKKITDSSRYVVLEYFFRRNTKEAGLDEFYRFLGEELNQIFEVRDVVIGNNLSEMEARFEERLQKISAKLKGLNTKLILVLDGLDEAEEEITRVWRGEALFGIFFLVSTRPVPRAETIKARLPGYTETLDLRGLSLEDVRSFLLELNREKILSDTEDKILKKIYEKSGGDFEEIQTERKGANPLYLRLFADGLRKGQYSFDSLETLPAGLDSVYEPILKALNEKEDPNILYQILFFLTLAKDYVSRDTISYFLKIDRFYLDTVFSDVRELLMLSPRKEEIEKFQLFHESLRDHFHKQFSSELNTIRKERLLPALEDWERVHILNHDPYTDEYILRYTISHLLEGLGEKVSAEENLPYKKKAESLVLKEDFITAQLETLNFYTVPLQDAGNVLRSIIEEHAGKVGTTRPIEDVFQPKKGDEPFRTTTFIQLVNHTGDLSHKASTDIGIAWKWIEEGKVVQALERISPIQDKQRLFDCCLLTLWLLTLQPDGEENRARLKLVLEEIEKNISPAEEEVVKWHERYSIDFFGDLCRALIERGMDVGKIFDRGEDEKKNDVILNLLGYEAIGEELGLTRLDERREFIVGYCKKIKYLIRTIKDNYYRSNTLIIYIESLLIVGDKEMVIGLSQDVVKLIKRVENSEFRFILLSNICETLSNYVNINLWRFIIPLMVEVAKEIKFSKYSSLSLSNLAKSVLKLGDLVLGKSLLMEALEVARKRCIDEDRSKALIFIGELTTKFIDVNLGMRLFQEAEEVTRKIEDIYNRSEIFCNIGETVSKLGYNDLGWNLFQEALVVSRGIQSPNEYSHLLCSLGEVVSKQTYLDFGKNLFLESQEVSLKIVDKFDRFKTIIIIVESSFLHMEKDFCKSLIQDSIALIDTMNSSFDQNIALNNLCELILKLNNINFWDGLLTKIMDLINRLEDTNYCGDSFFIYIKSISKFGVIQLDNNLFYEHLKFARNLNSLYFRSLSLATFSEIFLNKGNYELGYSFFVEAQEIMYKIKNTKDKVYVIQILNKIIYKYNQINLFLTKLIEIINFETEVQISIERSKLLSILGDKVYFYGDSEYGEILLQKAIENSIKEESWNCSELLFFIINILSQLKINYKSSKIIDLLISSSKSIEDQKFKAQTLINVGEYIYSIRDIELSTSLYEESLEIGRKLDDTFNELSYIIVRVCESISRIGSIDLLRKIYPNLIESTNRLVSSWSLSYTIKGLGESLTSFRDPEYLKNLLSILLEMNDRIEDNFIRCSSLKYNLELLSKINIVILNKIFLQKIILITKGIENSAYLVEAIGYISNMIGNLKNREISELYFPMIFNISLDIQYFHHRNSALCDIGLSISKLNDTDLASSLLPKLFEIVFEIEDNKILNDFSRLTEVSKNENSKISFKSFSHIIIDTAKQNIYSISPDWNLIISFGESISRLCDPFEKLLLIKDLIKIIITIEEIDIRCMSLLNLGQTLFNLGFPKKSKRLILIAIKISEEIDDLEFRLDVINYICKFLIKIEDFDLGKSIFPLLLKNINKFNDKNTQSKALLNICESSSIQIYSDIMNTLSSSIVELLKDIKDYDNKIQLLSILINSFEKKSNSLYILTKILEDIYKIPVSEHRTELLKSIAQTTSNFGSVSSYNFFESSHNTHPDITDVVVSYTEKYREIDWEKPESEDLFVYYIRSFLWAPYDAEFAKKSAYDAIGTLAKLGKVEEALEAASGIGVFSE
jgi:tetratricopeptide (TPR) repeat protein